MSDLQVVELLAQLQVAQNAVGVLRLRLVREPRRKAQRIGWRAETCPHLDGEAGADRCGCALRIVGRPIENADEIREGAPYS